MGQKNDPKNSILSSIKKMLGIQPEVTVFDTELIIHINSVIASLIQVGIGPSYEGYSINDSSNVWTEFLGDDKKLESVKTFIYLKVRLIFDPPSSQAVLTAFKEQIKEFEWRNYISKDTKI